MTTIRECSFRAAACCIIAAGLVIFDSEAIPVIETGADVRSMGLAGAVTTLVDFSAGYNNPGALAFTWQREFFAGFGMLHHINDIDVDGSGGSDDLTRLRFVTAGLVFPVPVERGGLTFSLAFSNPLVFDDVFTYTHRFIQSGTSVLADREYRSYGDLSLWSASGALQIAPGLGLGITLSLITGSEDTRFSFLRTENGEVIDALDNDFEDHYDRTMTGFEFRTGLLYQAGEHLRLGLRFVAPRYIRFDERVVSFVPRDASEPELSFEDEGRLHSSLEGAVGGAYDLDFVALFFDVHGRLPYRVIHPNDDIPDGSDAAHVRFGIGVAIEAPIVSRYVVGRTGYSFDQYDTHRLAVRYEDEDTPDWSEDPSEARRNIHGLAAGLSFDMNEFGLDAGYRLRSWKLTTGEEMIEEAHLLQEAALLVKWRF